MGLERLRALSDELEKISVDASGVLTHALMMREKEGQDKEVYNGMIQVRVALSLSCCAALVLVRRGLRSYAVKTSHSH